MILGLCIGIAIWLVFLLGHLAAMVLAVPARRAHMDRLLFLIGIFAIPATVGASLFLFVPSTFTHGGWLMGILWGTLTYVALFTLYMPFFYTIAASLTVQTLVLLAREADGTLPISSLFDRFGSRKLVAGRLTVMSQNGLVSLDGTEYRLTPKGKFIARMFAFLKRFWRLWPGG